MKTTCFSPLFVLAALALAFASGCQGWNPETGMTLPSGHYLAHPPQYFPPSEPYPLPKELRSLEDAMRRAEQQQQ
jgi:hypothetical protein